MSERLNAKILQICFDEETIFLHQKNEGGGGGRIE